MGTLIDYTKWHRPIVMGTNQMVSSGHPLASFAGIDILEKGGNAIDAGVAMGICLDVTQPELTNFGGVAPIFIYSALEDKIVNISGLGTWPKALTIDLIEKRGGKVSADDYLSSVVPSAPDAWITALDMFGTMSFSEVSQRAIALAENGFPAYPFYINNLISSPNYKKWDYVKKIFYPSGDIPQIGELIIQKDLARTLKRLTRIEALNRHLGRHRALMAARDEFYTGNIAKEMISYLQAHGGVLTLKDLEDFHVGLEEPTMTTYRGVDLYYCGPWTQGPNNAIALKILDGYDLTSLIHNSADYIHLVSQALDLAFADRYQYFGDPKFVDVPMKELLSKEYAEVRRTLIKLDKAWGKMPPPGDPRNMKPTLSKWRDPITGIIGESNNDTSYGCVVDKEGNAFSATPSDGGQNMVPGLGISISGRGTQSWLEPGLANSIEPGKRPCLSPNPALALKDGELYIAFGTPGGDSQTQSMVQVIINILDFKMNVQEAIEAPRFRSYNFPDSFMPHKYLPGRLNLEGKISSKTADKLRNMGYDIEMFPEFTSECSGVCAIVVDKERGLLMGGADPRRECYAIGY